MLPRATLRDFQAGLTHAAAVIDEGHIAWEEDRAGSIDIDELERAHDYVSQRLAAYTDQACILADETRELMERYSIMAGALRQAVLAWRRLAAGNWSEDSFQLPDGRWALSRRIVVDGACYAHATTCINPAVCTRELDQWEAEVRECAPLMRDAA